MSDKNAKASGRFRVSLYGGLLISLVILYFLSSGPLYWLYWNDHISGSAFRNLLETVYLPFTWVHKHVPGMGRLIDQYLQWWAPF